MFSIICHWGIRNSHSSEIPPPAVHSPGIETGQTERIKHINSNDIQGWWDYG